MSNLAKYTEGQAGVPAIPNNIFSANTDSFQALALDIFRHQYQYNALYNRWVNALQVNPADVKQLTDIPFLPVAFFKSHEVVTGSFEPEQVFESSGTTSTKNSRHLVKDITLYTESFTKGFKLFYDNPSGFCIIGLLPAYLERKGSSLVMMVDNLIKLSGHEKSGFYLYNFQELANVINDLEAKGQRTLLIGVTFALLDFAEQFPIKLNHTIVMETGGMKGRRREMIREEVHGYLQEQFGIAAIHSEYGMTELLSQAYSFGNGVFKPVPWMKILLRDDDDPMVVKNSGKGLINIIDLANVHSCSFVATDDAGILQSDSSFKVLGRSDNSDIRGCSLLYLH